MADLIRPDLCILGAGAIGTSLALLARQRGLDVVLVDLPGTETDDPAEAGLRRAALLASAARAQAIRTAGSVGLDNAAPKPNFRAISEYAASVAAAVAPRHSPERLTALGITVLAGPARFVDARSLICGDTTIRARQFALATGSRPVVPAVPGLDALSYFTPETILDTVRKLSHLVVIGGDPAAFELAQAFCRLGSMVTLVPQGGLLPEFEPELAGMLVRALRDEGVVVRDDAEVAAIVPRNQGTGIQLRVGQNEDSLDVSHILVSMGRAPVLDGDSIDKLKLRRDRLRPSHLLLGPDGQSSNGRLTALGGAAGEDRPHVAARQAALLVERLLGEGDGRLDPRHVPHFVATEPALAQLGPVFGDKGPRSDQDVLRANLAETDGARALAQSQGVVRLVTGRKGTILAAGALGPGAGEIIAMLALGTPGGLKLGDLGRLALPQSSPASALFDLAREHLAQHPRPGRARRLAGLGRLLP